VPVFNPVRQQAACGVAPPTDIISGARDSSLLLQNGGAVASGNVALTGVGYAPFSRQSGVGVLDLAITAAKRAAEDAGLALSEIDGISCFHEGDTALSRDLAAALGLPAVNWWLDSLAGGNYPCAAIGQAAMAVREGAARHVLVYRAMNGRSGRRMGQFRLDSPGGVRQFMLPYGFGSPPQVFGMLCSRFMYETGAGREALAAVAISQRHYAVNNPRAVFRTPLTRDEYLAGRPIAEPLTLFDCCQETDGACAVVVSEESAAASLRHPVIRVAAVSSGIGPGGRYPFDQYPDFTRSCLADMADGLFARAGLARADIDVAELYDAFTFEVLMQLEDVGFCGRGEAADFFDDSCGGVGSKLPINTHGGLLSEGYVQGLNHVCEAVLQLRGGCGVRQVEGARTALVTSLGFGSGSMMILARP
jgi:acetyl-CoA acetyltransferase